MKRKDIKLKYSSILNPEYAYMRLIPSSSISNYDSSTLSLLANELFKTIKERIHFLEKKFFMEEKTSIRYLIDIAKDSVNFYYIIPKEYKGIAIDTISNIWNSKCTVQEVRKEHIRILKKPTIYELKYKYEDFLSIKCDNKSNRFLYKALNILEIMKDGDNIQLAVNLVPYKQNKSNWKTYCDDIYDRYKKNLPIQKNNKLDFDDIINFLKSILGTTTNFLLPSTIKHSVDYKVPNSKEDLSKASLNKANDANNIIDTQIAVITKSDSKNNERNLAKTFCNALKEVDGDNKLIPHKTNSTKSNVSPHNTIWNIHRNKLSTNELSNFLTIPGLEILKTHKNIEHISSKQTKIIPELSEGICVLGTQKYKEITQVQYLNEYKNYAYLPIIVLTKMGGGKSTWFETIGVSLMNNFRKKMKSGEHVKKESFICLDFIKQNEVSYNIMYNMNPEDIVIIDLSTEEGTNKLGFYFKEVDVDYNDKRNRIKSASSQGREMMKLINTLNEGIAEPLTAPMTRYLSSAFKVCYIHENKSLKDAIKIIEDYETRHQYIDMIPNDMRHELEDEIRALCELDTEEKTTKPTLISGILARAYILQSDPILKEMYDAKPNEGINLLDALQEGKGIFILMPDDEFDDSMINIISTYVISRLFFVCKKRGKIPENKLTRCTLLIDELNIAPGCLSTLNSMIGKLRKYKLRPILSAHNFHQIETLRKNLNSVGVSVILPQGTHKSNFLEFENDFKSEGFYLKDLKTLQQWETLNLIETSDGKKAFISKFPPPVKGKIEMRDDLTISEFKEIIHERVRKVTPMPINNTNNLDEIQNKTLKPIENDEKQHNIIPINKNQNKQKQIDNNTQNKQIENKNQNTQNKKEDCSIKDLNSKKFNNLFNQEEFRIKEDDDAFNI